MFVSVLNKCPAILVFLNVLSVNITSYAIGPRINRVRCVILGYYIGVTKFFGMRRVSLGVNGVALGVTACHSGSRHVTRGHGVSLRVTVPDVLKDVFIFRVKQSKKKYS